MQKNAPSPLFFPSDRQPPRRAKGPPRRESFKFCTSHRGCLGVSLHIWHSFCAVRLHKNSRWRRRIPDISKPVHQQTLGDTALERNWDIFFCTSGT